MPKNLKAGAATELYELQLSELIGASHGLKQYAREEAYRKQQLNCINQLRGKENGSYALGLLLLGQFYTDQRRVEEAENTLTQSVMIMQSTALGGTAVMSNYLGALAQVKNSLDKNKEAEELYLKGVLLAEKDTINNPGYYEVAFERLVDFYIKMGRYYETEIIAKKISEFIERKEGRTFYYARVRAKLISAYYNQLKYAAAKQEAARLVKFTDEEFAVNNWLSLSIHNDLGIIALYEKDFDTSKKEFQYYNNGYFTALLI